MENRLASNLSTEQIIERMIRVNHAGEYGAKRIYEGQMQALKSHPSFPTIKHMYEQELEHLGFFEEQIIKRKVRPTVAMPVWHALGYTLGFLSGVIGEKGAMACTVAVEEVIDEHYSKQLDRLDGMQEEELTAKIKQFRQEELEHRDIGLDNDAENAPAYKLLKHAVQTASKAAIWISERF